jgi:hypothetical protein
MLSQNGWPAGTTAASVGVQSFTVAGVTLSAKAGDVTTVLQYVAQQFHNRVEPLHAGWCWGYSYRPIRGATALSNHSSGTAVDFNAPDHPLGVRGTFGSAKVRAIHAIIAEVDNAVLWGGDYDGRVDEMHFEINVSTGKLAAVAARLRSTPKPAPPKPPESEEDAMFLVMGAGSPPARMALLSGGICRELTPGERQTAQDTILRQGADQLYVEQATWDWWLNATAKQLGA